MYYQYIFICLFSIFYYNTLATVWCWLLSIFLLYFVVYIYQYNHFTKIVVYVNIFSYIMIIILICIVHYFILNPFEKVYFSHHLNNANRPLEKCINKKYSQCNGFPSGHAEIITIICAYLLYHKMQMCQNILYFTISYNKPIIYFRYRQLDIVYIIMNSHLIFKYYNIRCVISVTCIERIENDGTCV